MRSADAVRELRKDSRVEHSKRVLRRNENHHPEVRVNQDLLRKLMTAVAAIPLPEMISPATLDGLLSVRGVVEISDAAENEAEILAARASALELLDTVLESLVAMRRARARACNSPLGAA